MTPMPLADWRDFYVMIGTASGVLVGAAFVVATLASERKERDMGLRGFVTPTVVHLGSVLVGSAILTMPTLTLTAFVALLGGGGLGGVVYSIMAAVRIWHMKLDVSDRAFYAVLPVIAYGTLAADAAVSARLPEPALETLAVTLVALLVIGMRNAWDMATFMIMRTPGG